MRINVVAHRAIALSFIALSLAGRLVQASTSSQDNNGDWRFLDAYAQNLIDEARGTDVKALETIALTAGNDPSPSSQAYACLARALVLRLQFRLQEADKEATACTIVAASTGNHTAQALCGWLRMGLARIRGDYASMAAVSAEIAEANHILLGRAGITEDDAARTNNLFFLAGPESYADVSAWVEPTVHRSKRMEQESIKLYEGKHGEPFVTAVIGNKSIQFQLDTGAPYTVVSTKLAKALNIEVTDRHEFVRDARGNFASYNVGRAPSISLGHTTVSGLPLLVGSDDAEPPILGMDFLYQIGSFDISRHGLLIGPQASGHCDAPALLRSSMAPVPPIVAFNVDSNVGVIRASLDSGAASTGYAQGNWAVRDKLRAHGQSELKTQSVLTMSGQSMLAFEEARIRLVVDGKSFDRELRLYPELSLNTDLVMSSDSLNDFSYYFDLRHGFACIRAAN